VESDSHADTAMGVQCQLPDGSLETIPSDLIVDASGNGTVTTEFLKATGRRPPEETRIGVNMRIASAQFERVPIFDGYKIVYTFPEAPEEARGGLILPAENNTNHGAISPRSLIFLAGCSRLGTRFVVSIQCTAKE
jgi:hypothetical protein